MTVRRSFSPALNDWKFGKYLNVRAQTAFIGIHYFMRGEPAPNPLVLPLSFVSKPKAVMEELINAGADIDAERDMDALQRKLAPDALVEGLYVQKLGVLNEHFSTPSCVFGKNPPPIITDPIILEAANQQFGQEGTVEEWQREVAELATKSSFCMLAIMQAFASPLLTRVFVGGDEGFLINLAGESSRGKTTALIAGKSISGPGSKLLSWDQSSRSLVEQAAAVSDTFMAIDDLDKIASKRGFSSDFSALTHMLTSGESTKYSAPVKSQLPDLYWGFCGMTGARSTVEALSAHQGHQREAHERVRCLDVIVPSAENGGIWDRCRSQDSPRDLSDTMKAACTKYYGTALLAWLKTIASSDNILKEAEELIDYYIEELDLGQNDGIGHRVAKKFGLIFAGGILAQEAGLLPWAREDIQTVVRSMHENSLSTLYPEDECIIRGLQGIENAVAELPACRVFKKGVQPNFNDDQDAISYVIACARGEKICMKLNYFYDFFGSRLIGKLAQTRLVDAGVIVLSTSGKSTVQKWVKIGAPCPRKVKSRYLVINLEKLTKYSAQCAHGRIPTGTK